MTQDARHTSLVAFTTLAIAGAGALTWAELAEGGSAPPRSAAGVVGLGLLALGFAVSLLHLGRRDRAWMAARGLSRTAGSGTPAARISPLSGEGAVGLAALVLATLSLFEMVPAWAIGAVSGFAGGTACVFLWAVGHVYNLPGQLTWTGPSAYTPASGGLAFGAILAAGLAPRVARQPDLSLVVIAVAVDAFVWLLRWRRLTALALEHPPAGGSCFDRRHELLAARLLLADAIPLIMLFVWPTPAAALVAGAGVLVDRFGFYALALPHTTEREVDRVERIIARGQDPDPE